MPPHVLYEIPVAVWPVRLLMSAVCLLFVIAIFGWWVPRAIGWLRHGPRKSRAQTIAAVAVAMIPVVIGFGPLAVLIGLVMNPMTYVTDTGVMKESVFSQTPVSFTWEEIAHVVCELGRDQSPRWFTLIATDGRQIRFGNTGGVDFQSLHELFENQLGPVVTRRCPSAFRG